jgi:hypothetical protein
MAILAKNDQYPMDLGVTHGYHQLPITHGYKAMHHMFGPVDSPWPAREASIGLGSSTGRRPAIA